LKISENSAPLDPEGVPVPPVARGCYHWRRNLDDKKTKRPKDVYKHLVKGKRRPQNKTGLDYGLFRQRPYTNTESKDKDVSKTKQDLTMDFSDKDKKDVIQTQSQKTKTSPKPNRT
jgi:hypothetical protein